LIFFLLLVKGTLFNKNRSCDSECWPSNQLLTSKNSVRIYNKLLKAWTVAYLIGTDCLLDWNREYLTAQLNHMSMTKLGKLTFCDEDILCSSCFVSIDPKINFRPLIQNHTLWKIDYYYYYYYCTRVWGWWTIFSDSTTYIWIVKSLRSVGDC
jgi:hypothetical protein